MGRPRLHSQQRHRCCRPRPVSPHQPFRRFHFHLSANFIFLKTHTLLQQICGGVFVFVG